MIDSSEQVSPVTVLVSVPQIIKLCTPKLCLSAHGKPRSPGRLESLQHEASKGGDESGVYRFEKGRRLMVVYLCLYYQDCLQGVHCKAYHNCFYTYNSLDPRLLLVLGGIRISGDGINLILILRYHGISRYQYSYQCTKCKMLNLYTQCIKLYYCVNTKSNGQVLG